jgi:hypothetical protein
MRRLTRFAFCLLAAAAAFAPWHSRAQERPSGTAASPKEPTVMQRKLIHAQNILAGLALKDFDRIDKEADALTQVRQEATWRINETERYLRHSLAFLEQLQDMKKAAKAKNLDGATLAYLEMTRTCINCHEALRAQKRVKGED